MFGVTASVALATALAVVAACSGGGEERTRNGARGVQRVSKMPEELYATPVRVSEALKFTDIAAGYHHTCAVEVGGETYCWGYNEYGQLGSAAAMETCVGGMFPCSSTPVLVVGGHRFERLAASIRHTCGIDFSGDAYCWGFGLGGQLGDGRREDSVVPVAVAGGIKFAVLAASISGGANCGLTADGEAWCWGINVGGELGNGGKTDAAAVPGPVATGSRFVSISVGDQHACAVDMNRDASCWGANWYGQLGVGSAGGDNGLTDSYAPVAVLGGLKFDRIAASGAYSCGLQSDGATYCWGLGPELGANPRLEGYQPLPVLIAIAGARWISLDAGFTQTCALTEAGELYCWGHLTRLPFEIAETPVRIESNQAFVAFSAGGTHACAIAADGFAYCWGLNPWGQVGRPPSDP